MKRAATTTVLIALLAAGCSSGSSGSSSATAGPTAGSPSSTPARSMSAAPTHAVESIPPGDIPDSVAFIDATVPGSTVHFRHPEGWLEQTIPGGVRFTDKLNAVEVTVGAGTLPTPDAARSIVLGSVDAGRHPEVVSSKIATLAAGRAVLVVWRVDSLPNDVTGKVHRNEVETYFVAGPKSLVRMDLSGPIGADNVDAYRTMSTSLTLS
jgi:hypothetical protein